MQGIHDFIPTESKISYIQGLLDVGFDTIDMGSFVSPKAIPQMRDTAEVLSRLDLGKTNSKLLVIVANGRGAKDASKFEEVTYLGFPFSISEQFQKRNTNSSVDQALKRVDGISEICAQTKKEPVIYISMAFGNPYGENWNVDIASKWVEVMVEREIKIISLADTIGTSSVESIDYLVGNLVKTYPKTEFGVHLHTDNIDWKEKIDTAYKNGCRRFDGAIKGYGGCPMAADDLVGNMPTEDIISYMEENGIVTDLDMAAFGKSVGEALHIFPV